MQLISISIPNWEKFNPRSDRANYTWFRLQNDYFHDQGVFGLNDGQKILYLFILCECSKKNEQTIKLNSQYIAAILSRSEKEILNDLREIGHSGLIETDVRAQEPADIRRDDGKQPALLPATYERTNVRDETNVTNDCDVGAIGGKQPAASDCEAVTLPAPPKKETVTGATWKAFCDGYYVKYGHEPKWNATVAGQLANFVKRLGKDDAPLVAAFYLTCNKSYYVQNRHPVGAMTKDAEALYSQWKTGRKVTSIEARHQEQEDFYINQLRRIDAGEL